MYESEFVVASHRTAYVPLFVSMARGANEYQWDEVEVRLDGEEFRLAEDFRALPLPAEFEDRLRAGARREEFARCRFRRYRPGFSSPGSPGRLVVDLARTNYLDYLRSGEHLDRRVPGGEQTYRERHAPRIPADADLSGLALTNICGVGIFLVTPDRKVVVAEASPHVSVYAGSMSYSASGTMDWNREDRPFHGDPRGNEDWAAFAHPFTQVTRECVEEIGHEPHPERLTLFGLGLDARRLYVQFSFFEWTTRSAEEILRTARYARDFHLEITRLHAIDLEPAAVARAVREYRWEPAAEAALLCLCAREHGVDALERALDPGFVRARWRRQVLAEWSRRACLPGELAVMSSRYPRSRVDGASAAYAGAVVDFARGAVTGADVVEIGCGTGRLTEPLSGLAARYTAVDVSEEMLARARQRVFASARAGPVSFIHEFGQDYSGVHDVLVASLVLIHNVGDVEFTELAAAMSACADRILLFEHVDSPALRHPHTRLRGEDELVAAFPGFTVERTAHHDLLGDRIAFVDLVRTGRSPAPLRGDPVSGAVDVPGAPAVTVAGSDPAAVRLFFSYAHRDSRYKVELDKHLSLLRRQGVIVAWHDRMIPPGSGWAEEIDDHLRAAQVVLLLVSADFLASDYCMGVEVEEALRMHSAGTATVVPVVVRPCDWQTAEFGRLQALPTGARPISAWKNRDDAFADVAAGIRSVVAGMRGSS